MKSLSQQNRVILLASMGGALEFYDFVVYMFFANILAQLFFPATNKLTSLMGVFAVFAIGYIMRPLGGFLFGHFGDTRGRKATFVATVFLMAVPTFLIGLLPTFQQSGLIGPLLLVLLRILQGLSLGGEIPGAITFAGECVPVNKRGLTCGWIFFGINMGMMLGSAMSVTLNGLLSKPEMLSWGWRIPFLCGGLLGIVSYYLRKKMTESPLFLALTINKSTHVPVITLFRSHKKLLLRSIGMTCLGSVLVCVFYLYLPNYLAIISQHSAFVVNSFNTLNIVLLSILVILTGAWSDHVGRKVILQLGTIAFIGFGIVIFYLLNQPALFSLIFALVLISIFSALVVSCYPCALMEMFPTEIRYSGLAISYNISFALFGGLSPLIVTFMIKNLNSQYAPAYYVAICALACFIASLSYKSQHGLALQ